MAVKGSRRVKTRKLELFICISCGIAVIGFIFFTTKPSVLAKALSELSLLPLLAAVLCMIFYWLGETLTVHVLLKKHFADQKFGDSLCLTMGGLYFGAITPFSSGCQPFQAYYLSKKGRDVGVASSVLLTKFIVYQSALVALSTTLLLMRWKFFRAAVPGFYKLVLVGYTINLAILFFLIFLGLFRGISDNVCRFIIKLCAKIRLVKKPEETLAKAEDALDMFHNTFRDMRKHMPALLLAFACSVMELCAFFSVSYCVYRAFGLSGADLITVVAAQSFVLVIASFIPIPGAGIGAEESYYFLLRNFYPEEGQIKIAIIIWRLISYYLTLLTGMFFAMHIRRVKDAAARKKAANAIDDTEPEADVLTAPDSDAAPTEEDTEDEDRVV